MSKQKIKNLEKLLLGNKTDPKITCVEVTIIGEYGAQEILKMVLTEPKKTYKKILIDENGKKIKNPKFVEVKE